MFYGCGRLKDAFNMLRLAAQLWDATPATVANVPPIAAPHALQGGASVVMPVSSYALPEWPILFAPLDFGREDAERALMSQQPGEYQPPRSHTTQYRVVCEQSICSVGHLSSPAPLRGGDLVVWGAVAQAPASSA